MKASVLVKTEEEHDNWVKILRTTPEILIRLPQTQLKYVRHYFVGMFKATMLKYCYEVWSPRPQRTRTSIYSLHPSYLSIL